MNLARALASCTLAATLTCAASLRAEVLDVTAVAGHPPVFLWVKTLSESYIPAVNAALEGTDYSIDWTEAYGGTLAKVGGEMEAMEDGLAQVGIVSSLFEPSLLSLQNVTYVTPFGSPDVDLVLSTVQRTLRTKQSTCTVVIHFHFETRGCVTVMMHRNEIHIRC